MSSALMLKGPVQEKKISVVNDRIVIDDKTLDQAVSAKYIPLLGGVTNIEMEFN